MGWSSPSVLMKFQISVEPTCGCSVIGSSHFFEQEEIKVSRTDPSPHLIVDIYDFLLYIQLAIQWNP